MKKILIYVPGIALSVIVAAAAWFIESIMPIHLIGSAVIAMFLGMLINYFLKDTKVLAKGIKFIRFDVHIIHVRPAVFYPHETPL